MRVDFKRGSSEIELQSLIEKFLTLIKLLVKVCLARQHSCQCCSMMASCLALTTFDGLLALEFA